MNNLTIKVTLVARKDEKTIEWNNLCNQFDCTTERTYKVCADRPFLLSEATYYIDGLKHLINDKTGYQVTVTLGDYTLAAGFTNVYNPTLIEATFYLCYCVE